MLDAKIRSSEIVRTNTIDFPLGNITASDTLVMRTHDSAYASLARASFARRLRVERAKSRVRQVHPTFAGRCRSYIRLLRGISTSCEL